MRRVTRSSTKSVDKPKYTEPSSDVEDSADDKPENSSKPKVKGESTQKVSKKSSTTKCNVQRKNSSKGDQIAEKDPDNVKEPMTKPTKKKLAMVLNDKDDGDYGGEEETDDQFAVNYELSEKELKQINRAFDMNLPTLGDENLTSANVKTAMRVLGYEPRLVEIRQLMKKFSNSKGKINRDGFHKIMAYKYSVSPGINEKTPNDEISKVFALFDIDKTGKISIDNLRSIATELNEELTEDEFLEMIAEADLDGDSLIDKVEFENIMKKTSLY